MVNRGGVGAVFARGRTPLVFALLVLGGGFLLRRDASQPRLAPTGAQTSTQSRPAQIQAAFGRLPMSFEPNQGQAGANGPVKFLARGNGYGLYFTPREALLAFTQRGAGKGSSQSVVEMRLGGANPNAEVSGTEQLAGHSNYFIGNDPSRWQHNIPQFARVQYRDVYPGVDLAFYGKQGRLEYDFDVNPGGNPSQIELAFKGAKSLKIAPNGDLVLALDGRELRFEAPHIYQRSAAGFQTIAGSFALRGENSARFEVGEYDRSRTLVIDPVLTFSTYLGGSGDESCTTISGIANFVPHCPAIAVDSASRVYVAGATTSPSAGPFSGSTPQVIGVVGTADVFVARFDSAGDALEYVTYVGGSGTQYPTGVGVDSGFNAYVAGTTDSADYPAFNGLPVGTLTAGNHAFLSKLDSSGSANLYSTYLAGSGLDGASSLAVDALGRAYVFGTTSSTDFPTTIGSLQPLSAATNQFFFTKLDTTATGLSSLLYSTYFGGSLPSGGTVTGGAVAVDSAFNVYLAGGTGFTNMPTVNAFQATPPTAGPAHVWAARLNAPPANTQQYTALYETYLSGNGTDIAYGVATDGTDTYITGSTTSSNLTSLVTTTTPFQATIGGGTDAFVAKFGLPTTTGTTAGTVPLLYLSYLGGSLSDEGLAIVADSTGNARVTGRTASSDFPVSTSPTPIQGTFGGGATDAFFARIATNTTSTTTTSNAVTFLGGTGTDVGTSAALDAALNTYVAGETSSGSSTFPTKNPLQGNLSGPSDAFVSKLGPAISGLTMPSPLTAINEAPASAANPAVSPNPVGVGGTVTFTYLIFNTGDPVTGVAFTDTAGANTTLASIAASPSSTGSCPASSTVCNLGTVGTSTISSSSILSPAATVTVTVNVTAPSVTGVMPPQPAPINNVGLLTVAGTTIQLTAQGVAKVNDFGISASPLAAPPIIAGAAATYTVTVTPTSLSGFPGAVNLACGSGLPSGATCTFAPSGSIPNLNNGSQSRSLQISTQARVTTPGSLFLHGGPTWAIWLPVFGLMGAGISRKRRMLLGAFFAVVLGMILLQAGCGGGKSRTSTTTGTPAGSYTVILNASSGSGATRTTTVGLVVQ